MVLPNMNYLAQLRFGINSVFKTFRNEFGASEGSLPFRLYVALIAMSCAGLRPALRGGVFAVIHHSVEHGCEARI